MISVIVPVYKVEDYLHRCVDSILAQSYTDFELLLIDDGSPDNCGKICDEYAKKDSRVRVFHKSNGGVSSARNLGLDNARGEWLTFIDSDDYVDVGYLKELISFSDGVDFVLINNSIGESKYIKEESKNFRDLFLVYQIGRYFAPWGKLFKNEILTDSNLRFLLNIHFGEDTIFVCSYMLKIKTICMVSSDMYYYSLMRPGSLTGTIHSYEIEILGKKEYNKVYERMLSQFDLSQGVLPGQEILLTERVILAIMRNPNRNLRISRLKDLDLSYYLNVKKGCSWKENMLLMLLRRRLFGLYDLLLKLRYK